LCSECFFFLLLILYFPFTIICPNRFNFSLGSKDNISALVVKLPGAVIGPASLGGVARRREQRSRDAVTAAASISHEDVADFFPSLAIRDIINMGEAMEKEAEESKFETDLTIETKFGDDNDV
jgi:hypothetical protein